MKLTKGERRYLGRLWHAWPQFIPIGRVRSDTVTNMEHKGLVNEYFGSLTDLGLKVADEEFGFGDGSMIRQRVERG